MDLRSSGPCDEDNTGSKESCVPAGGDGYKKIGDVGVCGPVGEEPSPLGEVGLIRE